MVREIPIRLGVRTISGVEISGTVTNAERDRLMIEICDTKLYWEKMEGVRIERGEESVHILWLTNPIYLPTCSSLFAQLP